MTIFQNIYNMFQSFFEFLSFRTKPTQEYSNLNDIENQSDYDYVVLNNRINNMIL